MNDDIVKDIALAEFGRKELAIAETEMPGLMVLRAANVEAQPLKGAQITRSFHGYPTHLTQELNSRLECRVKAFVSDGVPGRKQMRDVMRERRAVR